MAGYGDFAYYYDLLTENVDYVAISEYISNLLVKNGVDGGILLDLACGTGELSFLLSEKGYDVIGVDASEEMLSIANEKKTESENSDIIFLCQKMEELDLFGTVNAVVCVLDSINHITNKETLKEAFRRVSLFMEDEGIFIFDVNTPYKHKKVLGNNTFVYDMDEVYCVWQNTTDEEMLTEISLDIFEKDEQEDVYYKYSESFCERGYEIDFLKELLAQYKFEIIAVYDEMSENELCQNSERAVFVLKKHGTQ